MLSFSSQAIYAADVVVEMDKGRVKWVGSPSNLTVSSYLALPSIDNLNGSSEVHKKVIRSAVASETIEEVQEQDHLNLLEAVQETIEAETRKEGKVELIVYK